MTRDFDSYARWLDIPPSEQPPNNYRLLGIDLFESNPAVIAEAATRRMAHVNSLLSIPQAEVRQRILNEIAAARNCLLDTQSKAAYDAELRKRSGGRWRTDETGLRNRRSVSSTAPTTGQELVAHTIFWRVAGWAAMALAVSLTGTVGWIVGNTSVRRENRDQRAESETAVAKRGQPTQEAIVPDSKTPRPATRPQDDEGKGGRSKVSTNNSRETSPAAKNEPAEKVPVPTEEKPRESPDAGATSAPKAPSDRTAEEVPTLDARDKLKKAWATAQTPGDFAEVARSALRLVDRAINAKNRLLANDTLRLALAAARKSEDSELTKQATLRYLAVQKMFSEGSGELIPQKKTYP
ncbi:MAG: hypothetical protein NTY19_23020 [Planctomycetota bacterium]|nr:hypothetical protein [Planctomycetota bacterium]